MCFNWVQIWAFGTVKLSVIFFYRSIFHGKAFNIASWSMVCIVVAWILGAFFAVAFQCGSDIPNLWSSAANIARHCTSGAAVGIGFSIPDVITDGLILAMPLYRVGSFFQDVVNMLTFARFGSYKCLSGGK